MSRRIVITSGKGGVGKTTIVSMLGITLARMGFKVLLVDMDFGLNNLDVVMGIENKIVYDIIDVLEGRCSSRQAIVQDFNEDNLYIFPSTHGFCRIRFGAKELLTIIRDVESEFDYVIIDCPAGIDGGFRRAVGCAGEHIVVTTPHLSAIRDADKVVGCLMTNLGVSPYVIINRVRGDLIENKEMLSVESIRDSLSATLIGVIPEDDYISIQMYKGDGVVSVGPSSLSVKKIAENIAFGKSEIYDCTKKYKGIIGGIRKKLRKQW